MNKNSKLGLIPLIYFQKIINLNDKSKNLKHIEILSRFYDNNGKAIPNYEIFDSKKYDLCSLDLIIFNEFFKNISKINSLNKEDFEKSKFLYSLNVSETSIFNYDDFFNGVEKIRNKYNLDSSSLDLELTEKCDIHIYEFSNI